MLPLAIPRPCIDDPRLGYGAAGEPFVVMAFGTNRVSLDAAERAFFLQIALTYLSNRHPHISFRLLPLLRGNGTAELISCFLVNPHGDVDVTPDGLDFFDFLEVFVLREYAYVGLALRVYCCWNQSFGTDLGDRYTLAYALAIFVMEVCTSLCGF